MIKAACIGTGGISGVHLRFLGRRADVEIAGLCDVDEKNLASRRKEFGGEGFTDWRRMLDAVRPDAVWLCTPPQVRQEPLAACAARGIPVFCEKPVERDEGRAAAIAAELARLGARVQVGYVFRSMPVVERLREEMGGDTVRCVISFYGCGIGIDRTLPAWFYDKEKSGGALIDQATHNLDLLRLVLGEVESVQALAANPRTPKGPGYTVDEVFAVSLRFASGVAGSHNHTWIGDAWRNEIVFSGERRLYRLDLGRGQLAVEEGPQTRTFSQGSTPIHDYQNELFLRQVSSGDWTANPSTYADGLETLRLTLACDRAVSRPGVVRISQP